MILEQDVTLALQRTLNQAAEHAEHSRQKDFQMDLCLHHVDRRADVLAHRTDVEIELVAYPPRLHLSAARNVLTELVDVVGDAAASLVLAKVMRQVDVDGLSHNCDIGPRSALFKQSHGSMIQSMKMKFVPLLLIAGAATAQPAQSVVPPSQAAPATAVWDPVAPYIAAGQDEPGYRSWYLAAPERAGQVRSFNDYLASAGVAGIVPTWELLRTATSWKECGAQPFEVPPTTEWPHMVQTLRYVRDYVIPAVGPVEPVSVYRNPSLNVCAGGAPESAHKLDSAVDLVPLRPTTREALMKTLCGIHSEHGAPYNAGLGFYAYLRFHVDSTKFRRWNMDPAVAAECPPILHPEDVASSGQPFSPAAPSAPVATPAAASPTISSTSPATTTTRPQGPSSGQPH